MQLFSWTLLEDEEVLGIGFLFMMINQSRPYGTFCMTFWKDLGMIRMKFTVSWLMILWKMEEEKSFKYRNNQFRHRS
jgi:hypothetical protein